MGIRFYYDSPSAKYSKPLSQATSVINTLNFYKGHEYGKLSEPTSLTIYLEYLIFLNRAFTIL